VFFSPAIQRQLKGLIELFGRYGLVRSGDLSMEGENLGKAVAQGLIALSRRVGFPTTLAEIDGFTPEHITKALQAAKDPQLASKLQNMPVPMTAETVDIYMGPVLESARTGEISGILMPDE
jgi:alcohol dehydrogenase